MDAIVTDGLYFPATTGRTVGGAPPPCPDPPLLGPIQPVTGAESLKPKIVLPQGEESLTPESPIVGSIQPTTETQSLKPTIVTIQAEEEVVVCPGDAIEGLGGWTWAFASDQTTPFVWPALIDLTTQMGLGEQLAGSGTYTINQATLGLTAFGIGQQRVNTAVRGGTSVCFRKLAPSTFPALGGDFHVRMIFRELTAVGSDSYFHYRVDVDNYVQIRKVADTLEFTVAVGGSVYTEAITITTLIGSHVLLDWHFDDNNGSNVAQHRLYLNGVEFVVPAHTQLLNPVPAAGAFAIMANYLCVESADSLELVFMGLRNLRGITLAESLADATSLGVV